MKILLTPVVVFTLFAASSSAQNLRSAVSIVGLDTNSCAMAAPCRTFNVAMSHTNIGGEIIALDSGGYGPFTIDRSITVQAAPGVYAGVTATPSGNAVLINASAGKVTLRNLVLNGSGTGNDGVNLTNSTDETNIENCVINGFAGHAVFAWFNVRVIDTTIRNCSYGIWIDNAAAVVKGSIDHSRIVGMSGGPDSAGPGIGIMSFRNATVTVRDSVIADAVTAVFGHAGGKLLAENTLVTGSSVGFKSDNGSVMRLSNNVATGNTTGLVILGPSTVETWSNNRIRGNATDINNTGTLTPVLQN